MNSSGVVFVADSFNQTIRKITAAGEVTTIGGQALTNGSADGATTTARFNQPYGIAVDAASNIWVADTFNYTIRRSGALKAPTITTNPTAQFAGAGGSVTFTVAASGVPTPGFQWQRKAKDSSDFVNLSDGGSYSGTTTATLTVSNITAEMSGDEFRAVAANLVSPNAESSAASLTVIPPPVITSAANATFRVGEAGSFTVTATSDRAVTYSAVGLPVGLSINASTGVISGTPASTSGSPFTVIITANNGTSSSTAVTQTFTLTVEPAQVPPTITTHPVGVTVSRGESITLTGAATGTAPLSYQWLRNGGAINGATGTTLTIPNAQEATAGFYTLRATNPFGSATSQVALVSVNSPPVLLSQPRTQSVLQGSSVTFSVSTSGSLVTTYQWRKNGLPIPGANGVSYSIASAAAGDAGNYDVVITNPLGQITSSVAQLTVVTTAAAPVFTQQPANTIAIVGGSVTLAASASAAPAATYQWRKDGAALSGATNSTLIIGTVGAGDAGNYSVVATNSAGSATSDTGVLRVIARSYAGIYFGSFGSNLGTFAIYIREDNTGVFLGYLPGSTAPVVSLGIGVNDAGQFSFSQSAIAASSGNEGEPARAAALNAVTVNGTIGADGAVSGSISGGASTTLSGARSASTGTSQNYAGYYQSASGNSAAVAYTIVGANGTAFALAQSGAATDGGTGTVNSSGQVSVSTGRTTINETIIAGPGAITTQLSGALSGTLAGATESVLGAQRLANISSRARVVGSSSKAIAGFVITGNESKPVLIRAVGPTLASAFNITTALTTPVLDLYRGGSLIASNTGVASLSAAARDAITAAGAQSGAFALGSSGADSAIITTLAPGSYTAQVSGAGNTAGIVLVEVYDLSSATTGQKLLNISTLANTGSGLDTLTAGVVVTGSVPKRVLIRAVGPGLAQLGVGGFLTNPTLQLIQGTQTIAQNTDWNNSSDKAAIAAVAPTVGAFPLVAGDSAMIVSLNPGNYTAQVVSTTGGTGIAIVEVYELP